MPRGQTIALLKSLRPDIFTTLIFVMVIVATLLPARGEAVGALTVLTNIAIGVLFFLHGARLSREAVLGGLGHWRFHLAALGLTFVLFPILGLIARGLLGDNWLTPALVTGLLYLGVLPSTVQSSIAYTAMARGNVPAAICSASLSNVVGVFATPLLVSVLIGVQNAASTLASVEAVVVQILLPFIAGHLLRPWIGAIVDRHKAVLSWFDRGVILAIVYRAFSAAVAQNLWGQLSLGDFALLLGVIALFLAIAVFAARAAAKALRFNHADTVALVFCGTQKSLASGAPMASILFSAGTVGAILLPLMLYHQMQLMLGAFLAKRFLSEDAIRENSPAAAE